MHHGLHQRGKEAERTAPKYATREDCVAEFGEGQCQQTPARAGVALKNCAQAQSSGSFWMPLMAGYMMGRLMGGGMAQQQPLFSSKIRPARPTVSTLTPAAELWRRPAGPHHKCAENRDGAEASHHHHRHPRRLWRVGSETVDHAA